MQSCCFCKKGSFLTHENDLGSNHITELDNFVYLSIYSTYNKKNSCNFVIVMMITQNNCGMSINQHDTT